MPIVVVALVLAARLLKADAGRADAGRLDWLGLALLSPGLAGIVFGLSESESHGGFADPLVWGPIVVGLVLVALFARHAWVAPRPLIDVRLFRDRVFAAASATVFLVGAALFGAMIILPLYYQVARGESALTAGLLMAPQGVGAALAMPLAGRLTDRVGGGRVAVVGLLILTLGTIPFAFLGSDTSYTLLAFLLVLRGLGIGASMMPRWPPPTRRCESAAVPRATSALNVVQRIGGSLGTALLAVVLQGEISDRLGGGGDGTLERVPEAARSRVAEPLAEAFAATFWWAVGMSVLALIPAVVLAVSQTREQRAAAAAAEARCPSPNGCRCEAGRLLPRLGAEGRPPQAAIALVHGLGEHSGRYERARLALHEQAATRCGRSTCAATARAPGQQGDTRFAPALEDIDALVARAGASGAGVPVFLYGHSLGALLSVLWLLERPAAPVRGAVISAIGLHSALREQAVKVRLARIARQGDAEGAREGGASTRTTLSRDPEVVEAYRRDKLVHDFASMGFGLDALEAIDAILEARAAPDRAAAADPRQRGRARLRQRRPRARRARPGRAARCRSTTACSTSSTTSRSRQAGVRGRARVDGPAAR